MSPGITPGTDSIMIYVWSFGLPKLLHWIYKPSASESTNQYYTELLDFSCDTDQLFKVITKGQVLILRSAELSWKLLRETMFTSGIQDDNMKISSINGKRSSEYHQFFLLSSIHKWQAC